MRVRSVVRARQVPQRTPRVNSMVPAIGPPPLATAATSGSRPPGRTTWRSPPSPRSWTQASWMRPKPCRRPPESWPPAVLSGSRPSRAMLAPPSMNAPLSPAPAEAERLEPDDGEDGEAVVELCRVDVGGLQLGALPHGSGGVAGGHGGHVVELVPARTPPQRRAEGVDLDGRVVEVGGEVTVRDDDDGRPVARSVAVVEAQRRGDHARREIVLHRHRVGVDRLGVQRGVGAVVDGDGPSCSRVSPNSCMRRWATMASQLAAETAP